MMYDYVIFKALKEIFSPYISAHIIGNFSLSSFLHRKCLNSSTFYSKSLVQTSKN